MLWRQFEWRLHALKVLQCSWLSVLLLNVVEDFQMWYCVSLRVKGLKTGRGQNLRSEKIECPGPACNIDLWQFCSLLNHKDAQYLIWQSSTIVNAYLHSTYLIGVCIESLWLYLKWRLQIIVEKYVPVKSIFCCKNVGKSLKLYIILFKADLTDMHNKIG